MGHQQPHAPLFSGVNVGRNRTSSATPPRSKVPWAPSNWEQRKAAPTLWAKRRPWSTSKHGSVTPDAWWNTGRSGGVEWDGSWWKLPCNKGEWGFAFTKSLCYCTIFLGILREWKMPQTPKVHKSDNEIKRKTMLYTYIIIYHIHFENSSAGKTSERFKSCFSSKQYLQTWDLFILGLPGGNVESLHLHHPTKTRSNSHLNLDTLRISWDQDFSSGGFEVWLWSPSHQWLEIS